jgi:DNA polymerase-1
MTVELPNIRKLFVPDPGYIIFDADLAGADAQVVAAEANDTALLQAFREGLDVHAKNAADLWGKAFTELPDAPRKRRRQQCKQAVHGTNYGASPNTLSSILGWSRREAEDFQKSWFNLHPGILDWHKRVESDLRRDRTARNKLGYRIIYFDRIDSLLPEALAWIPQSTVALTCFRGALRLEETFPFIQILLQVHDSLVFQVPKDEAHRVKEFKEQLANPIPYDPPLTIGWGLAKSDVSWGDCKKVIDDTRGSDTKAPPLRAEHRAVVLDEA